MALPYANSRANANAGLGGMLNKLQKYNATGSGLFGQPASAPGRMAAYGSPMAGGSPTLDALRNTTGMIQGHIAQQRPRPVANAQWMQSQGIDPNAGLGGVGGQYTPPLGLGAEIRGVAPMGTRPNVPSPNAMMDPRQRNFQGGGGRSAGLPDYAINPSGPIMQGMQDAGIGQVDPSTGTFLGNGAEGLMGNARAQRVAGIIGRLPGAGPSQATLAENAAATAGRRWLDENRPGEEGGVPSLYDRRANVRQRGIQNADARRARLGNFTVDERMQMGIPGLAVARQFGENQVGVEAERNKGLLGAEQIRADLGQRGIEAEERIANARNALDDANARGDRKERRRAQRGLLAAQQDARDTEREQNAAVNKREDEKLGLLKGEQTYNREVLEEDRSLRQDEQATRLEDQARAALASGDRAGYRTKKAHADRLRQRGLPAGTTASGGLVGSKWSELAPEERNSYIGATPQETLQKFSAAVAAGELTMSQQEMDDTIKQFFPTTTASAYNPDGWGASDFFGGASGLENWNRFGRAASGNGPQPPMIPGTNIPVPVVPGALGWAQTYMGW